MIKRVIIAGSAGQDGRLLFEKLRSAGHHVMGISRGATVSTDGTPVDQIDIGRRDQVRAAVQKWQPDEVYYLAAFHQSSQAKASADPTELFHQSVAVHLTGLLNFLEAIRQTSGSTRLFYAASCLIFGDAAQAVQNETTPLNPRCIYGITKAAGVHCCRLYRGEHALFAATGILYNHESVYRPEEFVSQKIVSGAIRISRGEQESLVLGDLTARIDWGYAPDFVEAMERILRLGRADDFIIAAGEAHTVQEFVDIAFGRVGLDWRKHVKTDPSLLRRQRTPLIGDGSRLRERTGWRPSVSFSEMVERLVADQLHAA